MNLYQEQLLDHYKNPRHHGVLDDPEIIVQNYNPSCGDQVVIHANVRNGILEEVAFSGKGCVISQAATSLLCEKMSGKSVEIIGQLSKDDILELIGINLGPTRLRCALLGLEALQKGIAEGKQDAQSHKIDGGV